MPDIKARRPTDCQQTPRKTCRTVKKLLIPAVAIAFSLLPGGPTAEARQGSADIFIDDPRVTGEPVYFSGDRFAYNLKRGVMTGSGAVEIFQGDSTLRGDSVSIDINTSVAEIEGDVVVTRLGDVVTGDRGVYDFEKAEGVFYGTRGSSGPWYVGADKVEREMGGRYSIGSAWLTTCNLPDPHYRFAAGATTVIPDDRVVARDLFMYAGSVPIFYLPYYSHRIGRGRPPVEWETGSQTDLGTYARLGYNLELGERVLLNPHVWGFTKSGVGGGLDGRLNLFGGDGKGTFDSFYISDRNDENTDFVGVEQDRGKIDLYYRQELPYDLTALVQAEYISDSEFLKTYDFDDFYGRELPETFVNLERTVDHSVISFTIRERLVDYIEDVDRLPEFRAELLEQRIWDTGFLFSATNDIAYLDNEAGEFQTTRNFSRAGLRYPLRFQDWLEVVPFVEGDATYYSKTLTEDDEYRVSWDSGAVAQSRFHKVYGSPFGRYTAFRHLIVPTLSYRYRPTPDEEPGELPGFDSIDLIDRENMVEIELKNYLQAKRPDGRSVDLAEYNFTAGLEFDDGDDVLATLENEVLIRPVPNWELALKALHDFRDETRSDLVSGVARYTMPESFGASFGLIHEDTPLKLFDTQAIYSVSKSFGPLWRAGFEQHYSISGGEFTYQEFWVWRDLHCWEALLRITDRQEATSVMFLLNIKAFPMHSIESKIALNPIGGNNPWPTRW